MSVLIQTTQGEIVVDLFVEKCPKSCLNFLKLCKLKFYNFTCCHELVQDFVASFGKPELFNDSEDVKSDGVCADFLINKISKVFNPEITKDLHHDKLGI